VAATDTDQDLLYKWREGDKKAGNELFQRHYDSISRFFHSKVGLQCDDLIQRTFFGCLTGLERFRGDASVRTLLFAIARNQLYSYYEDRDRDQRRFDPQTRSMNDLVDSPSTATVSRPEQKLLLEALRRLPVDTQAMLELHYWEGMAIAELAEVFELPVGTVKSRMRKGRQDLEGFINELGRSPELIRSTIEGLDRWAKDLAERFKPSDSPRRDAVS
jgi:RNA polymerase sigma factor (sigma-70 family)